MEDKRPPVRIRFRYNVDTGQVEEFIVDDNAASAGEAYHDGVAGAVAGMLSLRPEIRDAGPVRLRDAAAGGLGGENAEREQAEGRTADKE